MILHAYTVGPAAAALAEAHAALLRAVAADPKLSFTLTDGQGTRTHWQVSRSQSHIIRPLGKEANAYCLLALAQLPAETERAG